MFIGEKQHDALAEARAEQKLKQLIPAVALVTTLEGAKLIPLGEVSKLEKRLREEGDSARSQGYEHGHKVGLEKGLDEARRVLMQFEKAIQDAVNQRIALLEESRQKILELVIQISRKVTCDGLQIDPDATLTMIDGVIDQLVDRSRLRIKVHPNHLPMLEQNMDRFLSNSTTIKDLRFEADPRVREGGCFIETPTGDIDARLESQLEVIEHVLRGSVEAV